MKFRCIYDGDSFIDGVYFDDIESAKSAAIDILSSWLECSADMTDDEYNMMIENCHTFVEEYDRESDSLECVYEPSDNELDNIGWSYRGEA